MSVFIVRCRRCGRFMQGSTPSYKVNRFWCLGQPMFCEERWSFR